MVELTFLEVHFNDSELTGSAKYDPGEKDVEASAEPPEEDSSSGKGKLLAALVGLVFLVAVAYVVRTKVLGDDETDADTPEPGFGERLSKLRE